MTDALRALRFIQISNPENTPGTAEGAVEVLLGTLTPPPDDIVVVMPEGEERNSLAQFHGNAFEVGLLAALVFTGDVMFRHLPWWLSMAIRGNVTATRPNAGSQPLSWQWVFEPSLSVANTPDAANGIDTFTLQYGDNVQAYASEYCFATRLQISGAPNEACGIVVNITGRQKADTTKSTGLSVATVQRAPFNLAVYARDTSWANLGNTPKAAVLKGFTWTLDTMFAPRFTADGSLYFAAVDEEPKAPELRLILVRGTESELLRTAFEDQSAVYIQVKVNGATEMDSGQSNPPYLKIDGAYQIPTWPAWADDQGMATVEVALRGIHDSTSGKMTALTLLGLLESFPTTTSTSTTTTTSTSTSTTTTL